MVSLRKGFLLVERGVETRVAVCLKSLTPVDITNFDAAAYMYMYKNGKHSHEEHYALCLVNISNINYSYQEQWFQNYFVMDIYLL